MSCKKNYSEEIQVVRSGIYVKFYTPFFWFAFFLNQTSMFVLNVRLLFGLMKLLTRLMRCGLKLSTTNRLWTQTWWWTRRRPLATEIKWETSKTFNYNSSVYLHREFLVLLIVSFVLMTFWFWWGSMCSQRAVLWAHRASGRMTFWLWWGSGLSQRAVPWAYRVSLSSGPENRKMSEVQTKIE